MKGGWYVKKQTRQQRSQGKAHAVQEDKACEQLKNESAFCNALSESID